MIPRAILLDLDDTILDDSSRVEQCWRDACADYADRLGALGAGAVLDAIQIKSWWYCGDPERHCAGRLEL